MSSPEYLLGLRERAILRNSAALHKVREFPQIGTLGLDFDGNFGLGLAR
jgi:hypothetical protein